MRSSARSWSSAGAGFRFVALADDNFYPVTLTDLAMAERQGNAARIEQLRALRAERFELMDRLAQLPRDMIFFTQITMEAAEDDAFLDAMKRANIKGALVGVEAVTPEGLKDVYKGFNHSGEALVTRLRMFRERGVHVLGSFIFGLPSDRPSTFEATADIADRAGLTFAQFVMLTPYPGTVDFAAWEKSVGDDAAQVGGIPVTRHWLIPQEQRPKVYAPHPVMSPDEIRTRTQGVWDQFYSLRRIWARSRCTPSLRARVAFVLISKLYRQMYANTGIATDSARVNRANRWARLIAKPCRRLFTARSASRPDGARPERLSARPVSFQPQSRPSDPRGSPDARDRRLPPQPPPAARQWPSRSRADLRAPRRTVGSRRNAPPGGKARLQASCRSSAARASPEGPAR